MHIKIPITDMNAELALHQLPNGDVEIFHVSPGSKTIRNLNGETKKVPDQTFGSPLDMKVGRIERPQLVKLAAFFHSLI